MNFEGLIKAYKHEDYYHTFGGIEDRFLSNLKSNVQQADYVDMSNAMLIIVVFYPKKYTKWKRELVDVDFLNRPF